MTSQFDGMNLAEIKGMPKTMEATEQQLQVAFADKLPPASDVFSVALAQETYVRRVLLGCRWWQKRKVERLERALHMARVIASANFERLLRETRSA